MEKGIFFYRSVTVMSQNTCNWPFINHLELQGLFSKTVQEVESSTWSDVDGKFNVGVIFI